MAHPDEFWWKWSVEFALAVATFLAVLAALFLDWFRAKFFPPVLILSLVDARGAPAATAYVMTPGEQTAFETVSRWYHVRVENKRRMTRAMDTQVCLVAVAKPNAADQYVSESTGAIPLKVRNEDIARPGRIIGPPVEWDLCSLFRELRAGGSPVFQLQTVVAPTNVTVQIDQPFKTILTLQARSIEADSNILRLELAWDGQWANDTDQMTRHLVITVL